MGREQGARVLTHVPLTCLAESGAPEMALRSTSCQCDITVVYFFVQSAARSSIYIHKPRQLRRCGGVLSGICGSQAGPVEDAAGFGEVVIVAIP